MGFEYDQDVKTDGDFIQKIIKSNSYNPTSENTIDFDDELRRVINMSQTTDKRNVGSIIGATVFGLAGFLLLSFTVIGALAGGVLGVAVGRYAGKKMTKTYKKNKKLTQEDFLRIKLQSLLMWGETQKTDQAQNMNIFRMSIEKIVEEFAIALDLAVFSHPKDFRRVIIKLRKFLLGVTQQQCILLSFKLFQYHIQQLQAPEEVKEREYLC